MGALERGERNLSFHNLVLVSKALGMTLSQLLSGVEKSAEGLTRTHAKRDLSEAGQRDRPKAEH
jgi:transcriptional regulator with XRE-family HTH domain